MPCHLDDLVWSAEMVRELGNSIGPGLALDGDPDHDDVVQLERCCLRDSLTRSQW